MSATDSSQPNNPGPIRAVARLAVPMVAFFMIQNAMGLATLAMVGRLGDAALAGLGIGQTLYQILLSVLFGVDTGVQAMVSRTTGAGAYELRGRFVNDALLVAAPIGVALTAVSFYASPQILALATHDPRVLAQAIAFMRGAGPSLLFLALAMPVTAYWVASGAPVVSFAVMAISAPIQVALSLLLVFGAGPIPALGMEGAGIAFTLAAFVGAALNLFVALRRGRVPGLLRRLPNLAAAAMVARIGWPVSLQQSLLQIGVLAAMAIMGLIGTAQVAITNVFGVLLLIPILTATALGTAAATLVGQALGRGEVDGARRWGWRIAWAGALIFAPLTIAALLTTRDILGVFIRDPATLALAIWPARLLTLGLGFDAFARILGYALRGAGATKTATLIPFAFQWPIQLPLLWFVGVSLGFGLVGTASVQLALRVFEAIVVAMFWRGNSWSRVSIPGVAAKSAPPIIEPARRIAILGGAGAGKSTLARQLGERLALPVVHLDTLVYGPGWTRLNPAIVRNRLSTAITDDGWIVEGTYSETADLTLPRANLILWLEQPALLRLARTYRKTRRHANRPRADRPEGCEEGFGWSYAKIIFSFGRWTDEIGVWISGLAPHARVMRLRGDREIGAFLARCAPAAASLAPAAAEGLD